jgi:hypothetical protein
MRSSRCGWGVLAPQPGLYRIYCVRAVGDCGEERFEISDAHEGRALWQRAPAHHRDDQRVLLEPQGAVVAVDQRFSLPQSWLRVFS